MKKAKKSDITRLPPGPYATHFQEYSHDKYFRGARPEQETFTQRPRVSLSDFWANRLRKIKEEVDKAAEKE